MTHDGPGKRSSATPHQLLQELQSFLDGAEAKFMDLDIAVPTTGGTSLLCSPPDAACLAQSCGRSSISDMQWAELAATSFGLAARAGAHSSHFPSPSPSRRPTRPFSTSIGPTGASGNTCSRLEELLARHPLPTLPSNPNDSPTRTTHAPNRTRSRCRTAPSSDVDTVFDLAADLGGSATAAPQPSIFEQRPPPAALVGAARPLPEHPNMPTSNNGDSAAPPPHHRYPSPSAPSTSTLPPRSGRLAALLANCVSEGARSTDSALTARPGGISRNARHPEEQDYRGPRCRSTSSDTHGGTDGRRYSDSGSDGARHRRRAVPRRASGGVPPQPPRPHVKVTRSSSQPLHHNLSRQSDRSALEDAIPGPRGVGRDGLAEQRVEHYRRRASSVDSQCGDITIAEEDGSSRHVVQGREDYVDDRSVGFEADFEAHDPQAWKARAPPHPTHSVGGVEEDALHDPLGDGINYALHALHPTRRTHQQDHHHQQHEVEAEARRSGQEVAGSQGAPTQEAVDTVKRLQAMAAARTAKRRALSRGANSAERADRRGRTVDDLSPIAPAGPSKPTGRTCGSSANLSSSSPSGAVAQQSTSGPAAAAAADLEWLQSQSADSPAPPPRGPLQPNHNLADSRPSPTPASSSTPLSHYALTPTPPQHGGPIVPALSGTQRSREVSPAAAAHSSDPSIRDDEYAAHRAGPRGGVGGGAEGLDSRSRRQCIPRSGASPTPPRQKRRTHHHNSLVLSPQTDPYKEAASVFNSEGGSGGLPRGASIDLQRPGLHSSRRGGGGDGESVSSLSSTAEALPPRTLALSPPSYSVATASPSAASAQSPVPRGAQRGAHGHQHTHYLRADDDVPGGRVHRRTPTKAALQGDRRKVNLSKRSPQGASERCVKGKDTRGASVRGVGGEAMSASMRSTPCSGAHPSLGLSLSSRNTQDYVSRVIGAAAEIRAGRQNRSATSQDRGAISIKESLRPDGQTRAGAGQTLPVAAHGSSARLAPRGQVYAHSIRRAPTQTPPTTPQKAVARLGAENGDTHSGPNSPARDDQLHPHVAAEEADLREERHTRVKPSHHRHHRRERRERDPIRDQSRSRRHSSRHRSHRHHRSTSRSHTQQRDSEHNDSLQAFSADQAGSRQQQHPSPPSRKGRVGSSRSPSARSGRATRSLSADTACDTAALLETLAAPLPGANRCYSSSAQSLDRVARGRSADACVGVVDAQSSRSNSANHHHYRRTRSCTAERRSRRDSHHSCGDASTGDANTAPLQQLFGRDSAPSWWPSVSSVGGADGIAALPTSTSASTSHVGITYTAAPPQRAESSPLPASSATHSTAEPPPSGQRGQSPLGSKIAAARWAVTTVSWPDSISYPARPSTLTAGDSEAETSQQVGATHVLPDDRSSTALRSVTTSLPPPAAQNATFTRTEEHGDRPQLHTGTRDSASASAPCAAVSAHTSSASSLTTPSCVTVVHSGRLGGSIEAAAAQLATRVSGMRDRFRDRLSQEPTTASVGVSVGHVAPTVTDASRSRSGSVASAGPIDRRWDDAREAAISPAPRMGGWSVADKPSICGDASTSGRGGALAPIVNDVRVGSGSRFAKGLKEHVDVLGWEAQYGGNARTWDSGLPTEELEVRRGMLVDYKLSGGDATLM